MRSPLRVKQGCDLTAHPCFYIFLLSQTAEFRQSV